nr:hypothetical protein [uncultured Flavobacterium sp.]
MIRKLFFILSFFTFFSVESQNQNDTNTVEDTSIATQLYTKCFVNLNQGSEIFEKYPSFKNAGNTFCSLITCSVLLSYKEIDIQKVAEQRLIGITTQLFKSGNPVYLVSGLDSSFETKKKNEDVDDDNRVVYISYGECVNPFFLHHAAEIVNKQTNFLFSQLASK